MATMSVSMPEVMKDMTFDVEVTGQCRTRARIHAGVWLMRLAARVMGVGASCIVHRASCIVHRASCIVHRRRSDAACSVIKAT